MGYFSNATENQVYEEKWCLNCIHHETDGMCPVMQIHFLFNYEECNNENSPLHMLIPRSKNGVGNNKCLMHVTKVQQKGLEDLPMFEGATVQ